MTITQQPKRAAATPRMLGGVRFVNTMLLVLLGLAGAFSFVAQTSLIAGAVIGWLSVACLVAGSVLVARAFHRVFNVGLVVAFVCAFVIALASTVLPHSFPAAQTARSALLMAAAALIVALIGVLAVWRGLSARVREYR